MSASIDLQKTIAEALRAYELAHIERERLVHTRVEAKAALMQEWQEALDEAKAAQVQTLSAPDSAQQRMQELVDLIGSVGQSARDLLEKAGLAHIIEAPSDIIAPTEIAASSDASILATAFSAAHTAYADLRMNLYRFAQALLARREWRRARVIAESLRIDTSAPLHAEATDLLCTAHYREATGAFEQEQWITATDNFNAILRIDPSRHDVKEKIAAVAKASHVRPIKRAFERGELAEAAKMLGPERWLLSDPEVARLWCEAHYRLAANAMKDQDEATALVHLSALREVDPHYRDIESWTFPRTIQMNWLMQMTHKRTLDLSNVMPMNPAFLPKLYLSYAGDLLAIACTGDGKPGPRSIAIYRSGIWKLLKQLEVSERSDGYITSVYFYGESLFATYTEPRFSGYSPTFKFDLGPLLRSKDFLLDRDPSKKILAEKQAFHWSTSGHTVNILDAKGDVVLPIHVRETVCDVAIAPDLSYIAVCHHGLNANNQTVDFKVSIYE